MGSLEQLKGQAARKIVTLTGQRTPIYCSPFARWPSIHEALQPVAMTVAHDAKRAQIVTVCAALCAAADVEALLELTKSRSAESVVSSHQSQMDNGRHSLLV